MRPIAGEVAEEDTGRIANLERRLPPAFVRADGLHVTQAACDYIRPLIQGEVAQATRDGLPDYGPLPLVMVPRRLARWVA